MERKNIRPGECSWDGLRGAETIRSFCVFASITDIQLYLSAGPSQIPSYLDILSKTPQILSVLP